MGSSSSSAASKVFHTNNKDPDDLVTISEKVNLTKNQQEVLQMICNSYQMTVSEYMQEALVEAMRFDIEEGNFCDVLLNKIIHKKEESKNKENKEKKVLFLVTQLTIIQIIICNSRFSFYRINHLN